MRYTQEDEARFWEKVDTSKDCWEWTSSRRNNYGTFSLNGRPVSAHRFSYFISTGQTPTQVRHKCDNPPCVNPEHLVGGTSKDNSDDKTHRDRHQGLLSNSQILEIRSQDMSKTIVADTAKKYGISEQVARALISGKSFSHLPGGRKIVRQMSRSKLSIDDISNIKEALKKPWWGQVNALARQYGVTHGEISAIKNGRIHAEK